MIRPMILMLLLLSLIAISVAVAEQWTSTVTEYDNGQWSTTTNHLTSTTTVYAQTQVEATSTPTTSYVYYMTSTSYSTTTMYQTAQNVIVTVTSLIPCPITSTLTVYQPACCHATITSAPVFTQVQTLTSSDDVGDTTVTTFTTVTAQTGVASYTTETLTSGADLIIVVIANPTSSASQAGVQSGSNVVANSAENQARIWSPLRWVLTLFMASCIS